MSVFNIMFLYILGQEIQTVPTGFGNTIIKVCLQLHLQTIYLSKSQNQLIIPTLYTVTDITGQQGSKGEPEETD